MARRSKKRKPAEQVELSIDALSHDGRGIASRNGKRVFIEGALPEEEVIAEIGRRRSRFEEGKVLEIKTPAINRVAPRCPHAAMCGGCSLQHLSSDAQIDLKQSVLVEQLSHFGGLVPQQLLEPVTGPVYQYRRKARLGVRYVVKRDEVLVGFREKGSSFITDISRCHVLDQRVGDLITALRDMIRGLDAYRILPQIEVAMGDTETALVFRHLEPLSDNDLNRLLAFAQAHNIHLYLQPGGVNTVHKLYPGEGDECLHYRLPAFNLEMRFHPMDFTQVNPDINRKAVNIAIDRLAPRPGERVLDLFCGLGNFTLPLAKSGAEVIGVEGSIAMVERGIENAHHNGLDKVRFYAADLTQPFAGQPWAEGGFDKILIDPPRSGAQEIVQEITKFQAKRIVYVSCNPATLARDAGILKDKGYRLEAAGIMDMFPHTAHVESIAVFER